MWNIKDRAEIDVVFGRYLRDLVRSGGRAEARELAKRWRWTKRIYSDSGHYAYWGNVLYDRFECLARRMDFRPVQRNEQAWLDL